MRWPIPVNWDAQGCFAVAAIAAVDPAAVADSGALLDDDSVDVAAEPVVVVLVGSLRVTAVRPTVVVAVGSVACLPPMVAAAVVQTCRWASAEHDEVEVVVNAVHEAAATPALAVMAVLAAAVDQVPALLAAVVRVLR